jgi:hypothetical protein
MQTRISEDRIHLGAASAEGATVLRVLDKLTHNSILSPGRDLDEQIARGFCATQQNLSGKVGTAGKCGQSSKTHFLPNLAERAWSGEILTPPDAAVQLLNCQGAFWIGAVEIGTSSAVGWSRSMKTRPQRNNPKTFLDFSPRPETNRAGKSHGSLRA